MVCQRQGLHEATLLTVHQLVSKLAMAVTRMNEKAEQSASNTSVYYLTSQR